MMQSADIRAEAKRIQSVFVAAGAAPLEAELLQPADTLLDLYGEDIRARAYVTQDPLRGERMLRPDFTVPVVQMHMAHGAEPARYTYSGEVFRRQETDLLRANEYIQVGYELFERDTPAASDAEVFALIRDALGDAPVQPATGDIGILMAGVAGLRTTEARKAALLRHIWRPGRFRALLDRFSGRAPVSAARNALLTSEGPIEFKGAQIGLRSSDEVQDRIRKLKEDAAHPPISELQVNLLSSLLAVRDTSVLALAQLRDIAVDMPEISVALDLFEARLEALEAKGVEAKSLEFEASYGRTSMEYYDGFVFGFHAIGRTDLPPVATGGRYDALTRQLGQGATIPAVGGVIRPDVLLQLKGDA